MGLASRPVIESTQLLSQRNQSLDLSEDALEGSFCCVVFCPLQERLGMPEDHIERGPHLLGQSRDLRAPQRALSHTHQVIGLSLLLLSHLLVQCKVQGPPPPLAYCMAASTRSSRCLMEALNASSRSRKITFSKALQTVWYKRGFIQKASNTSG